MKKIFIIITLSALALCSCINDLDVTQESKLTSSDMWKTEADATGAMYGLFHQVRAAYQTVLIYWGDFRAGTFKDGAGTSGAANKMFNNQLDATETKGTNWASSYTAINEANLMIKHVPSIQFSNQNTRNRVLGSAYFVRALLYFNLARVFGDVPILLDGFESDQADLQPAREDVSLVLDQVLKDIEMAESYMPASVKDPTTANLMAIKMLKADYWLWMAKTRGGGADAVKNARKALNNVIINADVSLMDNYADVFDINKKNNREMIFVMHFGQGEYEGGWGSTWLIPTSRWYGKDADIEKNCKLMNDNDQRYIFSDSMLSLIRADASDTRIPVNYGDWTDPADGRNYTWINKYAGLWEDNRRYFIVDEPIYRYAEALLMMAEVELASGNNSAALDYVNMVAKRAYKKDNYYTDSSDAAVKNAIIDEYMKEFAAEAKTWWVYIRMGVVFERVASLTGRESEKNVLLWPITDACFLENPNMTQTEGYY